MRVDLLHDKLLRFVSAPAHDAIAHIRRVQGPVALGMDALRALQVVTMIADPRRIDLEIADWISARRGADQRYARGVISANRSAIQSAM